MNNKGQALVTFILLLPLIFLLIAIIYDLGALELTKQKTENEIKSTINYALNNIEDKNIYEKSKNMLDKNIEGNKTIIINDKTIKINIKTNKESIFPNIIKDKYNIDITYNGYIENNKIKIIKE